MNRGPSWVGELGDGEPLMLEPDTVVHSVREPHKDSGCRERPPRPHALRPPARPRVIQAPFPKHWGPEPRSDVSGGMYQELTFSVRLPPSAHATMLSPGAPIVGGTTPHSLVLLRWVRQAQRLPDHTPQLGLSRSESLPRTTGSGLRSRYALRGAAGAQLLVGRNRPT
ncbi:hypothetical protein NDU88_000722 [Pleurodeles waltl]|uniref:Uncharacterized protein n=1 Tax=Pleurodeles waltl TaxID=8319 RepID=A0AAV7KU73_PLEWA|nr:hypothetical protein NDU88_000722 [Pleurodeles waltl]